MHAVCCGGVEALANVVWSGGYAGEYSRGRGGIGGLCSGGGVQTFGRELECWPTQQIVQMQPIKTRAGIGFAAGCNVLVAGHMGDGVTLCQIPAKPRQCLVLRGCEMISLQAFKLDADGVVVAFAAAPVAGSARVPGAGIAIHKLPQHTRARDEKMR